MGPQEMLDWAEVEDKWMLTPMKNFKSPRLTARIWRTPLAVMITALIYKHLLDGRNPCFALIGAEYGVGSQFEEGFHNGINRFIGTFVGGFLVIPFHWLYVHQPFAIPNWIWLVAGLCLVLWCSLLWVLIALLLTMLILSCYDREKGLTFRTFWMETKYAFQTYLYNNRKNRQKEQENFGMQDVEEAGDGPIYPAKKNERITEEHTQ